MRVHLFGSASSPSCANFALRKTAKDNEADVDSSVIETVNRNFYVDDCLKSVSNEDEAVNLASRLRELLARGGFKQQNGSPTPKKSSSPCPNPKELQL